MHKYTNFYCTAGVTKVTGKNVSFFTLYSGQFMFSTQFLTQNYLTGKQLTNQITQYSWLTNHCTESKQAKLGNFSLSSLFCIDGFQSNYAWFNQLWLLAFFVIGDMISKFYWYSPGNLRNTVKKDILGDLKCFWFRAKDLIVTCCSFPLSNVQWHIMINSIWLQNKLGTGHKVDLSEDKPATICLNSYYDMWHEIDVLSCHS